MTAPHIGNTGVNDEDDESGRMWVAGYVVRDPARCPVHWRSRRSLPDELERAGRRRHQRHRHPRADPAPARARRDAGRHRPPSRRDPDGAARPGAGGAGDARRRPRPEVSTREPYVVPAVGPKRFTSRRARPRHQADTPPLLAERGVETHVLPADRDRRRPARARPGRGVRLQRPGRPGRRRRRGRGGPRRAGRRACRCSASASATRSSAGRSASAPTSSATATAGSTSRCSTAPPAGSGDRAQPRLRRRRAARPAADTPFGRVEVSHVGLNDDVVEGLRCLDAAGVQRAVPPRGGGRPARRRVPVRPVRRPDGRRADAAQRTTSRTCW